MKQYFQSTAYVIFVIATFTGLLKAFEVYENPLSVYEHPIVWTAIIGLFSVIILKEVVNALAIKKARELQNEKWGIEPKEPNEWLRKFFSMGDKSKSLEEENERIILDHNYDGIKELDNSLPPWWVYLFYVTILFAAIYLLRFEVLDGDTQLDEYEDAVAQAKMEVSHYKATATDIITVENLTLLTSTSDLKRGKAVYNLNCASCHLSDGGGSIGPNLTDEYWILGGGIKNVFSTIANGGRDGKGMIAWDKTLKAADIAKVASYVLSLQGTTPLKAKAPQGEKWEDSTLE